MRRPDLERQCDDCGWWIEVYDDPEGRWEECDCAAGYVWLTRSGER